MKFPIGGKVRKRKHDPMKFRNRRYSPDEKRCVYTYRFIHLKGSFLSGVNFFARCIMKKQRTKIAYMVRIAILATIATVLMLLEFPMPFIAPPFYEFDFSEVPVLIGTFAMGPLAGIIIEFIKVLLNLFINGTITAGVGEFANFLMGCAFIVPAGLIYKYKKTKTVALVGMICGTLVMALAAFFINSYLLIPTYGKALGMDMSVFVGMGKAIFPFIDSIPKLALFCVVPFNLIKGILVSTATFVLYKHIHRLLNKI